MGGHVEEWKPSREILERYNAAALDLVGVLLNVIHAVFVCFEWQKITKLNFFQFRVVHKNIVVGREQKKIVSVMKKCQDEGDAKWEFDDSGRPSSVNLPQAS